MDEQKSLRPGGYIDLLLDAVCMVDADGRFVFVSAAAERVFGYRPQEMIGRAVSELVHPEDRDRTLSAAHDIMRGDSKLNFENRYIRKDGSIVHILWSARWSEADQLRIAVARDITARKQAEVLQAAVYAISEAAHAAEDLAALFGRIHRILGELLPLPDFSVALRDEEGGVLRFPYHAPAPDAVPVHDDAAAIDCCEAVIHARQPLLRARADNDHSRGGLLGVPLDTHKGSIGALLLRHAADGTAYTEQHKELLNFVSTQIATAIERKRLHEQLLRLAQSDVLTGLPNRALLDDRLEMALARAHSTRCGMSLLYLDLDRFKAINDTLGHDAGDQLLREIARRLKASVRKQDTVARMGGDEFVIVLEGVAQRQQAAAIADNIRRIVVEPIRIDETSVVVEPSIGIAVHPEDGSDARSLLRRADEAMFAAKKRR